MACDYDRNCRGKAEGVRKMTIKEIWNKADENGRFICYLAERWHDEHEYEDIGEYLKTIQRYIPEAYKMTKRPFGFKAKGDDGEIHVYAKMNGKYINLVGDMRRVA